MRASTTKAISAAVSMATAVSAASLSDVCTTSYVQASLPASDAFLGITINPSTVTAAAVANASVSRQNMFPDASFSFCNVTFAYSHNGRDDQVLLNYWLPAPSNFQNRYLSTGGGGFAINSGTRLTGSLPGAVSYGAVGGLTDGGYGSFTTNFDTVFLLANGTINYESLFMFGYKAHYELSLIGKAFTKGFFNMTASSTNASDTKLYSYYQGCSEGGREGWSQVQRFGDEWDGAITGAPAFRFAFQQIQHIYSNVVEQDLNYYPPPCELQQIVNATIAACDPLDGKTDGVVARTDLCQLNFNISSTIGQPYYCAAASAVGGFGKRQLSSPAIPAQNGTVTAQGVAVAQKILDGIHDSDGRRVYLSYQPAATFADAKTAYNSATGKWELSVSGIGSEWPARFLELQNTSSLTDFSNVTVDTLRDWIFQGWMEYEDTLQTTWPDLTPFQKAGGKVLHFHGESDNSIPTASSVHYWDSVRQIMYPNMTYNASADALNDWYRLFLVPGAAHCSPNSGQANGPFPQTNLAVLIDWVENGVTPTTLNATHLAGADIGANAQICAWPLRPYWVNNGTTMECVYDQASLDTWNYNFDAFDLPVY